MELEHEFPIDEIMLKSVFEKFQTKVGLVVSVVGNFLLKIKKRSENYTK